MKLLLALFVIILNIDTEAKVSRVKGYIKKNGTYVQPHFKTSVNKSKLDNWSTKGNTNPMTGKKGYADPYK